MNISPRIMGNACRLPLLHHLKRGGLVAYPTESCYGIGCLPTHARALNKLVHIKKRPQHKGMIVIGKDKKQLQPLLTPSSMQMAHELTDAWPAPKTILLFSRPTLLPILRGKQRHKLAVRVPSHAGARHLCAILNTPLVSTSCNRSKGKSCKNVREVRRQFGRSVWVINGRIGNNKQPSQIIDGETFIRLR